MSKKDYYNVLGVNKDSGDDAIKKAYRRLAMKYHPDRNPDNPKAEEQFKEAKEAYEVLSDPKKRATYDQYGSAAFEAGGMGGGNPFGGAQGFDFGDIFGQMFGQRAGPSRNAAHRGADLRYNVQITLEQAAKGDTISISIPTDVACEPCNGTGSKKGTAPKTCHVCGGIGQVRMQQGPFSIQQVCPQCDGSGHLIETPCPICRGVGHTVQQKTLEIKVPEGIDHEDRIRVTGEGELGLNGGGKGDLYIVVHIQPHDVFTRSQDDLRCEMPISFVTAALGGVIQVPTLSGIASVTIPPESQNGKTLRLKGKGIKGIHSSKPGDLLCQIIIETPINLTEEQKKLLRQFESSQVDMQHQKGPQSLSWSDKMKKFFS